MTRTWAMELAGTGVTINAIAPDPVETELFRRNTLVGREGEQRILSMIPMRRLGRPEEVAATIEFLLSKDAGFITGQTIFVDGGGSIGRSARLTSEHARHVGVGLPLQTPVRLARRAL